uniref:BPTI/Kunitz inhibitor domain-containing protein n=1 Tax=Trichobilharzia regenti TaxID=157069 RepID=A0AA85K9D1_TRIRE|nr:unnamed protein product [Trichobilharzia regenti]
MFGIILLILIFQKCSLSFNKICFYRKDEGYGNDTMEKFYYDATVGQCMKFTYRGDGGNDNNFDAKDVCEKTCKSSGTFDRRNCRKPHIPHYCPDATYHYYYDQKLRRCENYRWLQCGKNENNFESEEECQVKCGLADARISANKRKFFQDEIYSDVELSK